MQLTIQSLHMDVSRRTLQLISRRFNKLETVYDRITKCDVVLKKEKDKAQKNFIVEAKLFVPRKILFAQEQSENFLVATGKIISDLTRQLKVHKAKLNKWTSSAPAGEEES